MNPSLRAAVVLLALGSLTSCDGVKTNPNADDSAPTCSGPTVKASDDLSIVLNTAATPTATGTVCDGDVTLTWAVESAPVDSAIDTGDLDVTDPTAPTFQPDVVGTYVLSVVASDSTGAASAADYVVITVTSGNAAPIADCGPNKSAEVGERVDMDGSGSSDPEGAALEYSWTLSSVPSCSALGSDAVYNATSVAPSVVPDCAGVYVMGLAVSDGENWSAADYCSITVGAGNQAPIADAGTSTTLSPCTAHNYELDGYGSYDPEGAPLTYMWTVVSAPTGSTGDFDDPTLPNPIFRWETTGAYTFQLQVSDGVSYSAPDIVTLTFTDTDQNHRPIANAGDDQTITVTTDCSTASYVFTCDDCPSEDVDLDGSASDDPIDGDDLDFLWSDASGELTLSSQYSPVTTAYTPSFPSEYNTAIVKTWNVLLTVSDCADSDTDSVNITYTCTGEYSP